MSPMTSRRSAAITAAAVSNAVFAATGRRIRKLPLENQLRSA